MSAHSHPVNRLAMSSVSMAPASRNISTLTTCNTLAICSVSMASASRNISTLTSCQQIGNLFGQHGSSFTEYQHTHELSTDWQFVRSAWLQLHGISAHSLPVNRLAICSVSMAPASRNISTLTSCQQI